MKGKNKGRGRPRKILLSPSDGTTNTPTATNAIPELDETPIGTPIGISPAEVSSSHVPTRSSYGKDLEASRPKKGQHVISNGTIPDLQKSVEIVEETVWKNLFQNNRNICGEEHMQEHAIPRGRFEPPKKKQWRSKGPVQHQPVTTEHQQEPEII
ncbi:hypothetical protein HAX54_020327 [Datura stramonium]|uniref:Uncharacterized protein n=1 Tax=Datura stramonium TaxID=4076 RepID=A0ABS8UT70_DATST|nr:hypothetical protein [Datura stramonium]